MREKQMAFLIELLSGPYLLYIIIIFIIAVSSIIIAAFIIHKIRAMPEGTDKMKEIAEYIREGSEAYLIRQLKTILIIGAAITVILFIFFDVLLHWRVGEFSMVSVSFFIGMLCSYFSGYIAMHTATNTNVRVTNDVKEEGYSKALILAFDGGLVMGLMVVGLSLLAILIITIIMSALIVDPALLESTIIGLAFGASFAALFALLGGGIFTKAADVGADLVGKIEAGIPEDDPRNPGVIADNVGDNVGDIAGRGADLFESITGQIIASMVLSLILFNNAPSPFRIYFFLFPLVSCAFGLLATLLGKFFVRGKDTDDPWKILIKGMYATVAFNAVFFLINCLIMFQGIAAWLFFGAAIIGLVSSLLIGFVTLYYTGENHRPVKSISKAAEGGPATTMISGFSVGLESTAFPIIIIIGSLLGSYILGFLAGHAYYGAGYGADFIPADGGVYGISMGVLGLFSVCGMVLGLDGYGPIVDNAGGIAEMANLEDNVREETDKLDSCGNTTKAYTKGYAIATAILASILIFQAFTEVVKSQDPTIIFILTDPFLLVGLLLGATLVFTFCAFTFRAVGESAQDLITEIRRQFDEIPGLKEGKENVHPEYAQCVDICTKSALQHMIIPGFLVVATPFIIGFFLGIQTVAGFLIGAIVTGVVMALFLNNGGGALDNAKKLRKGLKDKSNPDTIKAYEAAVQGDIVGDPMKDTAGPSINVLLTLILALTLEFAIIFAQIRIF